MTIREENLIDQDFEFILKTIKVSKREWIDTWLSDLHPFNRSPTALNLNRNWSSPKSSPKCYKTLIVGQYQTSQGIISNVWSRGFDYKNPDGNNLDIPPFSKHHIVKQAFKDYYNYFKLKNSSIKKTAVIPRKALFISRENAKTRRILNRDALFKILEDFNFIVQKIDYSGLSFSETVENTASASLIFGAHGAGFANTIFSNSNSVILEMHPYGAQKFGYAAMANALEIPYLYW